MSRVKMKVVLQPKAPVAVLRSRANNQFVKTLDYLPGSTMRGAFAEIFINKRGDQDPDFQRIFVDEGIWFSDFLPNNLPERPVLLPLTALACKRHDVAHPTSLRDRLHDDLTGRQLTKAEKLCPECGEPLHSVAGYLCHPNSKEKVVIGKQLRMHVGISRATGSAMSGLLFSYEMLTERKRSEENEAPEKALYFVGTLEAESENLFEILNKVVPPEREHLSICKARTRGLGELAIAVMEQFAPADDLETRIRDFNAAVNPNGDHADFYFSITLNSHLALKDDLGQPVLGNLTTSHFGLGDLISPDSDEAKSWATFMSTAVVAGWNAALGLPKPDTHAISLGSVFAFRVSKKLAAALIPRLRELENEGLGERRAEGFGKLTICHRFHIPEKSQSREVASHESSA